jgi:hypothetical protein
LLVDKPRGSKRSPRNLIVFIGSSDPPNPLSTQSITQTGRGPSPSTVAIEIAQLDPSSRPQLFREIGSHEVGIEIERTPFETWDTGFEVKLQGEGPDLEGLMLG